MKGNSLIFSGSIVDLFRSLVNSLIIGYINIELPELMGPVIKLTCDA